LKQPKILSIIPARSGSTRIKNKNIRKLNGLPLLSYTIIASKKSKITRTIVSTDDKKIANISKKLGAEVPFLRPKQFATKNAKILPVILHCLNFLESKEQYIPDYVMCLSPTSPFRTHIEINKGISMILHSNQNSLTGITKVTQHPAWIFKMNSNQKLLSVFAIKKRPERSQDLPEYFYINGSISISKISHFKRRDIKYILDFNKIIGLEMNPLKSFDIDTESDFYLADLLMKSLQNKNYF